MSRVRPEAVLAVALTVVLLLDQQRHELGDSAVHLRSRAQLLARLFLAETCWF